MSEQQIQSMEDEQPQRQVNKAQIIAAGGTLLASGIFDAAMHGDPYVIGLGLLVAGCVGAITPSVQELFLGSQADEMVEATDVLIDQLGYRDNSDLPQDAISKLRRIFRIDNPDELRAQLASGPKSERPTIGTLQQPGKPGQAQPARIPAKFKVDSVIEQIRELNKKGYLYFGQGSINKSIAIHYKSLYHLLDASSSGKGKSNRMRLAMMQLVDFCDVYYMNPLANPLKAVEDERQFEVWTPLYERLAEFNGERKPMKSASDITALVRALSQEVKTREQQESETDFTWTQYPIFLFIDEMPLIRKLCGDALMDELETVMTSGRQFLVYAYVASQSAAVSMISQNEAVQAQYKTRVYGGGDKGSANRIMKGPVTQEEETTLHEKGPGLTLMLAERIERQFVRAPLVTNEGMFAYLGLDFDPRAWFPATTNSFTQVRRGGLTSKPSYTQETNEREQQPMSQAKARPVTQAAQPMTFDDAIQLFLEGKIDDTKLFTLSRILPGSPAGNTEKDTDVKLSSEGVIQASLNLDEGNIPDASKDALIAPVAPFPTLPDLSPKMGKDDLKFSPEQEADFLRRYTKTPNVSDCLEHMTNAKGGIGLSNHYYKWANWIAKQQSQR